jgi:hypothetical protein
LNVRHSENPAGAPGSAPKLVTTAEANFVTRGTGIVAVLIVLLLIISQGVVIWLVIAALEASLWTGWWLRWGRFWHPVKEFRWERSERRRGHRSGTREHVSYRAAWEAAGGEPGAPPS